MRYWIGVASRDHVMAGVTGGFCQLGHGKAAPIRRLQPGDWIVYYSPRITYPDGASLQAFTALGQVAPGEPYAVAMSPVSSRPGATCALWYRARRRSDRSWSG